MPPPTPPRTHTHIFVETGKLSSAVIQMTFGNKDYFRYGQTSRNEGASGVDATINLFPVPCTLVSFQAMLTFFRLKPHLKKM